MCAEGFRRCGWITIHVRPGASKRRMGITYARPRDLVPGARVRELPQVTTRSADTKLPSLLGLLSVPALLGRVQPRFASLAPPSAVPLGLWPLAGLTRPALAGSACRPSQRGREETAMLKIYSRVIDVVRGMRTVIEEIEARDLDLARQLRRAMASVALNVSEGGGSHGGTRLERYRNALGSARETGLVSMWLWRWGTWMGSMRDCSMGSIMCARCL